MSYRNLLVSLVWAFFVTQNQEAFACGAMVGSGAHSPNYDSLRTTQHPSSILLYKNPASALATTALDEDFQETLENLGHTVATVISEEQIKSKLQSENYDLIIGDYGDIATLRQLAIVVAKKIVTLPIVSEHSKEDQKKAKEQYGSFIWSPSRKSSRLAVIEELVNTFK